MSDKLSDLQLYELIGQADETALAASMSAGDGQVVLDLGDGEPDYRGPVTRQGLLFAFERGYPSDILTPFGRYHIGQFYSTPALIEHQLADADLYPELARDITLARQPAIGSHETIPIVAIRGISVPLEEPHLEVLSASQLRRRWLQAGDDHHRLLGRHRQPTLREGYERDEKLFRNRDSSIPAATADDLKTAEQVVREFKGQAVLFFDPSDKHWHYGIVDSLNGSITDTVVILCETAPASGRERHALIKPERDAVRPATAAAIGGIRFSGNAKPTHLRLATPPGGRAPSFPSPSL
jgi:hypothetical protein